jgi:hypothetical protein
MSAGTRADGSRSAANRRSHGGCATLRVASSRAGGGRLGLLESFFASKMKWRLEEIDEADGVLAAFVRDGDRLLENVGVAIGVRGRRVGDRR